MQSESIEPLSTSGPRFCKLAAAALISAGLTAPFITFPLQFERIWPLFVLPMVPLMLGIIALRRIGSAHTRMRGQSLAMTAIILSLVWLGSTILLVSLGVHEGWSEIH